MRLKNNHRLAPKIIIADLAKGLLLTAGFISNLYLTSEVLPRELFGHSAALSGALFMLYTAWVAVFPYIIFTAWDGLTINGKWFSQDQPGEPSSQTQ